MRAPILYQAAFALAACSLNAQQKPRDILASVDTAVGQSREAALKSLETLRELVNENNYRAMGFDSQTQVREAELGEPLVLFYVRLDDLRQFRPGGDPLQLVKGGKKVLYPVLVRQQVRSSVTLDNDGHGWKAVSFGGPRTAGLIAGVRGKSTEPGPAPKAPYFRLDVLALSLTFLGTLQGDKLVLVPVLDDRQGRWKAGVLNPAEQVFEQLVADANAYNGLPL